jgi:hypothetical protein
MAKFVGTAELIITPEKSVLLVDGEEFPFDIAADDIEVTTLPNGASFFRVSVYARSVQVRADLGSSPAKDSESDPAEAPADPPVNQPWAGMVEGDEIQAYPGMPEPPESIRAIKEIDSQFLPYLIRGNEGWSWSRTPYEQIYDGEPWKSWFKRPGEGFTTSRFKVVRTDG